MNPRTNFAYDWADLAFGNKKSIRDLKAIFIAAPREISAERFTQIIQTYLPKGNLVLGLSKEDYVQGLEGQPQFKMLQANSVQGIIDKVNSADIKHKIYTLTYSQRDLKYLLEKLCFAKVIFVNGSWYTAFHFRPEYHVLAQSQTSYEKISPFASEQEAREYEDSIKPAGLPTKGIFSETEMLGLASQAAKQSFDFGGYQTGAALGVKKRQKYQLVATSFNGVVPFQTYAMHYGASREQNFSPPNDQNHYDANHAETELLIKAQKGNINLGDSTLFINLMPCPSCARMLAKTDIAEIVYSLDHSNGYAVKMLEAANKKLRRVVL